MFSQLREQFEFIIVDSGPVLPVVDTLVVGQFADFALLSIMRDVSQSYQILEARSRLARVGINVLGTIVTCRGGLYGLGYRYGYALNSPAAATA
jgi:tyrosine-protein kinase Etk/Wzc